MARTTSYPTDFTADGDDKVFGTNAEGDVTKNLTVEAIAQYVNSGRGAEYPIVSEDGTQFIIAVANDGTLQAIPPTSYAASITGLPTVAGLLNVGETLTVTPAATDGLPSPTTVFRWQRSLDGLTGWTNIDGATGTTYLLGSLDENRYVRASQITSNILNTATANSASTGQIQPSPLAYLLDDYSGAAAAYSLRKLSSTYSGDAIVVRRTSDNTTQSIGFVGNELDTTSLESFCSGTDGFVTTWYDQSGNGNDAAQANAASQPKIVSSGSTILENGKVGIYFDGINDFFNTPSTIMTDPNVDDYKSLISIIGVDRTSTDTLVYEISYANANQVAGSFNRGSSNSIQTRTYFGSVNDISEVLSKDQNLIFHISQSSLNSNNSYLDGSLFSGTLPARSSGAGNYLGLGFSIVNYYKGTFQEFVFYNADQSTNRTGIETNINDFYNIY